MSVENVVNKMSCAFFDYLFESEGLVRELKHRSSALTYFVSQQNELRHICWWACFAKWIP